MTSISTNVYIEKLDGIVSKYNSTYNITNLKLNLLMQNQVHMLNLSRS